MPVHESFRSWTFDVRRSIFKLEWSGVEKVDVEIGDVEALAGNTQMWPTTCAHFLGSACVSRAGERVSRSRTLLDARNSMQLFNFFDKIVSAGPRNQHARRMRYPKHTT